MRRDSTFDSAIWILVILFCPILALLPLLAIVWILAPYFIEQWKEDWRAAKEKDRKLKEMAKLCEAQKRRDASSPMGSDPSA